MIVWRQNEEVNVFRCGENEQTVLVEGDVHTPDGLAVDWIHDLLFWTDGALDTVCYHSLFN